MNTRPGDEAPRTTADDVLRVDAEPGRSVAAPTAVDPDTPARQVAAQAAVVAADVADAAATEAAVAADSAERAADIAEAAADDTPTPLRARTRTLLLVIVTLGVFYTCFLARELIVPIVLSMFFALAGNPIVARLQKLLVPRLIGALLVVVGSLGMLIYGASLLLPPAATWMSEAPRELRQHLPKLRELTRPFQEASKATESLQQMTEVGPPAPGAPVQVVETRQGNNVLTLLADAPRTLASVLVVLILSFFFMVYGEDLLRRFVTVVPGWRQKRITVDILRAIQSDISRYMLTISLINVGLGAATTGALLWLGLDLEDAVLWGVVAGVLNYAPYIGPLFTAIALLLVGLVEYDTLTGAMMPPVAFLGLHLIEGQFVTPMILGRRMAISPVILMLWLFLWGWLWGIAGLLLAVPMLVCFKIYCDRVASMKRWAMMMEP